MGRRKPKQRDLWISADAIPKPASHPFYAKVNELLDERGFDRKIEHYCQRFYQPVKGRPSLAPGVYFRLLLVGYFEGIDSERGIAWRVADSLSLREFLGFSVTEQTPDHSTVSRTRRLFTLETHKLVFQLAFGSWPMRGCWTRRRWPSTRRRWKPMRRCGRSGGGTTDGSMTSI